ncbi:MAG: nucleotidyltransferase domain-containing protein [Candidatus Hydrogenedentota bacterium]
MSLSISFDEKRILNDFVNRITREFGVHLSRVIFFGSRAKGVALPWSDFDILIVLDKRERDIIEGLYDKVMDLLLEYGVNLSLKIYDQQNFQRMMKLPTPFMAEIQNTGVELWKRE